MKEITLLALGIIAGVATSFAQPNCLDWNEYVEYKNTIPATGYYTLEQGAEEKAAQTYFYSGPGNVTRIRIDGQIPAGSGWWFYANLTVKIYDVDASNRPTSNVIAQKPLIWFFNQTSMQVSFGGAGIPINNNFAVGVEMSPLFPGQQFQVKYTGSGEGNGEDLPSTAGTSTGGNWVSMLPGNDGDLYIVPRMQNHNNAAFEADGDDGSVLCNVGVGQVVSFTDMSDFTKDGMFNTIGLPGYTGAATMFDWDFGDGNSSTLQNPTHAYTTAGLKTVTLTTTVDTWPMGGNVCQDTYTMDISVGLDVVGTPTALTCYNDGSGQIAFNATGGDGPTYSYSTDGANWQGSPITGLDAGVYNVWVQDGSGCVETGTAVTITEPSEIEIATPTLTTATCGSSDGGIQVIATGGSGTLTYSLDNVTYQPSGNFTNLSPGGKTIYVKDVNGCIETLGTVVPSTNSPTLSVQSYTNVSCYGGNDGTIVLIGSGGTGALTYSIDGGTTFQATGNFNSVMAGNYTPIVQDAAGCIGTIPCIMVCGINITEPQQLSFSLTSTPTLCFGSSNGTIDVVGLAGGTGTTTYSKDGVNFQSSTHFSGLSGGVYNITAKDAAGCLVVETITVDEPSAMSLTISGATNLSCFESGDGEISVSVVGGTPYYTYSIDGSLYSTNSDFVDLDAGLHTIMVQDDNGCLANITTTLTEPSQITATITEGASTCGNATGTALVVGANGSGSGYIYTIDDGSTPVTNTTGSFSGLAGGSYGVIVEDGTGCQELFSATVADSDGPTIDTYTSTNVTCNGGNDGTITITGVTGTSPYLYSVDGSPQQSSNVLTGLDVGDHTVLVEDALGCLVDVTITLTEPAPIVLILTHTDATCHNLNDGTITVSAGGGTGALAYSIGGAFQSTPTFTGLYAGIYEVTVKDAGQCESSQLIGLSHPDAIVLTTGVLNVQCFGGSDGSINASAVGGTGTINYSTDDVTYQGSGSFTGLSAGSYTVYAQDANGCTESENVTLIEPDLLVLSAVISDVSCANGDDGVVDLTITGGKAPYTVYWSNFDTSEDIFNLESGVYTVSVVDANGCIAGGMYFVDEPSNPLILNGTVSNATGATNADGAIDITATGGTAPYTYVWSNGATTEDLNTALPGVYLVTVIDANGCETSSSYTISFTVGLEEVVEHWITVYPNPAREIVYINIDDAFKVGQIIMSNLAGEIVRSTTEISNQIEFDVTDLAEGMYFINIYAGDQMIIKKVVIMK